MKTHFISIVFLCYGLSACAQAGTQEPGKETSTTRNSVPCEGCEALNESPLPYDQLPAEITMPGYDEKGPVILVSGTVYQPDGKTPAPGVLIYIYHTDREGIYPTRGDEKGWGRRHGFIRGWMKTNAEGRYSFKTIRPASYPNTRALQHIHVIIREPDGKPYWINEFHFEDDPNFKASGIRESGPGGSGILKLKEQNGVGVGRRNIILK